MDSIEGHLGAVLRSLLLKRRVCSTSLAGFDGEGWVRKSLLAVVVSTLGLFSGGCGDRPVTGQAPGTVPGGAFAQVGERVFSTELLAGASGQSRTLADAMIRSALLGKEAQGRLPHRSRAVERGVLGRRLLEKLAEEEALQHPVTEEEQAAEREENWYLYDRPRAVSVAHFFIPVPELAPETERYALAEAALEAARSATNVEEFAQLARSVPTDFSVDVSTIPPVDEKGRVFPLGMSSPPAGEVDPDFAQAAAALSYAGQISEVVASTGGFHVLYAMEVFPAVQMDESEVQEELTRAVLAGRVDDALKRMNLSEKTKIVRHREDLSSLLRSFQREQ